MTVQELIEKLEAKAGEEDRLSASYLNSDYTMAHMIDYHGGRAEAFEEVLVMIKEASG